MTQFPDTIGGPVRVKTIQFANPGILSPSIVSQRVLWNGYFNEVAGTALN